MSIDQDPPLSSPTVGPERCNNCGGQPQPGFRLALCHDCRQKLAKKPIPGLIKLAGLAVCGVVVFALARVPNSLSGAIAFERGHRDEAQRKYHEAIAEYRSASTAFPDAELPLERLGIVEYKVGDFRGATQTFNHLAGRKVPLTEEVKGVILEMERHNR
jgi:tetratricopeptide (TPR) repeat protein